jgi:hypothetical protein
MVCFCTLGMFVSKEKSPMKNILYSIYPFINSSTYFFNFITWRYTTDKRNNCLCNNHINRWHKSIFKYLWLLTKTWSTCILYYCNYSGEISIKVHLQIHKYSILSSNLFINKFLSCKISINFNLFYIDLIPKYV